MEPPFFQIRQYHLAGSVLKAMVYVSQDKPVPVFLLAPANEKKRRFPCFNVGLEDMVAPIGIVAKMPLGKLLFIFHPHQRQAFGRGRLPRLAAVPGGQDFGYVFRWVNSHAYLH